MRGKPPPIPATLVWAGLILVVTAPIMAAAASPQLGLSRAGLLPGRAGGRDRPGPAADATVACCRFAARTAPAPQPGGASADRWCPGRGCHSACRNAVADQPARCGGCAAAALANAIFGLGHCRDVSGTGHRAAGGIAATLARTLGGLAATAHGLGGGDRHGNRRSNDGTRRCLIQGAPTLQWPA